MGREIERKFLLNSQSWRAQVTKKTYIEQGYLTASGVTVRVRLQEGRAILTIKGKASGLVRDEYEYPIPLEDAKEMLEKLTLHPPVEKYRYLVPAGNGLVWEIDEYLGDNAPLFTAEIELPSPDTEFEIPEWLGMEVSGDRRYTNRALSRSPYSRWKKEH